MLVMKHLQKWLYLWGDLSTESPIIQLTSFHANPEIKNNLKSLFKNLKRLCEVEKLYY